ncbi:MAG: serine hydrolase domain-containing protein [Flavobacteriales bacterium]
MKLNIFLVILLLFIFSGVRSQTFQETLNQICIDHSQVGASVVTRCNAETNSYHYGVQNINSGVEINDNTIYRIASISKALTTIGAMKLYETGLLDLDEDISTYLGYEVRNPSFPEVAITAKMLLSHKSSIVDGSGYGDFLSASYSSFPPISVEEVLLNTGDYYTADMFNSIEPGTYFNYSNINFGLLGTVIEAVANQRFDLYMDQILFEPLELNGGFNLYDIELEHLATLYRDSAAQSDDFGGGPLESPDYSLYTPGTNAVIFSPHGGCRLSAVDLAQVMAVLLDLGTVEVNGSDVEILSSETVELMLTPQYTYDGSNGNNYFGLFSSWGLGIHLTTNTQGADVVFGDLEMAGHPGEAYGLISDMYVNTTENIGIVFMTNGYYSGGNYDLGLNSSFYTLEEEIFSAAYELELSECDANNVLEVKKDKERGEVISIKNVLGQECNPDSNELLFLLYENGTVEKKWFAE